MIPLGPLFSLGHTDCIAFIAPSDTSQSNAMKPNNPFVFNSNLGLEHAYAQECDLGSSTQTITSLTVFVTLNAGNRAEVLDSLHSFGLGYTARHDPDPTECEINQRSFLP